MQWCSSFFKAVLKDIRLYSCSEESYARILVVCRLLWLEVFALFLLDLHRQCSRWKELESWMTLSFLIEAGIDFPFSMLIGLWLLQKRPLCLFSFYRQAFQLVYNPHLYFCHLKCPIMLEMYYSHLLRLKNYIACILFHAEAGITQEALNASITTTGVSKWQLKAREDKRMEWRNFFCSLSICGSGPVAFITEVVNKACWLIFFA